MGSHGREGCAACRELGNIALLPSLLRLQQRGGSLGRQQAANLLYALEAVRVLSAGASGVVGTAAGDAEAPPNAEAILASGVVDILAAAPLGDHAVSSTAVRAQVRLRSPAVLWSTTCLDIMPRYHGPRLMVGRPAAAPLPPAASGPPAVSVRASAVQEVKAYGAQRTACGLC